MISNRIINHMEADDLRNLLIHYEDLNARQKELIMLKDDIIEDLNRLQKDMQYAQVLQDSCNKHKTHICEVEELMRKKYKAYLPKPFVEEDYEVCQELEKMMDEEIEENKDADD